MASLRRKMWVEKKSCPVDPRRPEELGVVDMGDCGRDRRLALPLVHLAWADKQTSLFLPRLSGRSHSQKMSGEKALFRQKEDIIGTTYAPQGHC